MLKKIFKIKKKGNLAGQVSDNKRCWIFNSREPLSEGNKKRTVLFAVATIGNNFQ